MKYKATADLSNREFKRLFGVHRDTFKEMTSVMKQANQQKGKAGVSAKLSIEDQILVALQYWREYRTYFHIASDWGVSESTVCRIVQKVENVLIKSARFRLEGKKCLRMKAQAPGVITVDVTESPIERPKHGQKQFYSGKKKCHTLKSQLVVELSTFRIICTAYGKGKQHDFRLFKASSVHFSEQTQSLADKGYQGLQKLHANSLIPIKKPRGGQLTPADKSFNRLLAQRRIVAEHVNRNLKIFKIISERYRNRRRRFGLRYNLIAAIYNFELGLTTKKKTSTLT